MKPQSMWVMLGVKARTELADLLLDKKVWLALLGVVIALSTAYGWNITIEVFAALELLIVCLINALREK